MSLNVQLHRLDPGLPVPSYAHPGDAGVDLLARTDAYLAPGHRAVIPTGIALGLPDGYAAFIQPRSGLAAKHGITVLNTPGLIDAGYRGELAVILLNTDRDDGFAVKRGDRIAQLVVQRVEQVTFTEVEALADTARGTGGFGSTGVAAHP